MINLMTYTKCSADKMELVTATAAGKYGGFSWKIEK
jgi:hypothetical protein